MATATAATTPTTDEQSESSVVDSAVARLHQVGVNLLAIDFDQTILSVHTGGRWPDTLEALLPHVRPEFRDLIQAAVRSNIQIAVVTFTPQIKLVRGVLDHLVGIEAAQKIPIRGGDRSWQYKGQGSMEGKQAHMASAVEEIETKQNVLITKASTLLIDDDASNIQVALSEGTRAIWLNPKKAQRLFQEMKKMI